MNPDIEVPAEPEVDPATVVIDLDVHDSIIGHTTEVKHDG